MKLVAVMMILALAPFASAVPIDGGDGEPINPGPGKGNPGQDFVMPGDRVVTGIEMQRENGVFLKAKKAFNAEEAETFLKAKKAFLKAKKAFNGEEDFLDAKEAFMDERDEFLKAKKAFDPKESDWPAKWSVMPGDNVS